MIFFPHHYSAQASYAIVPLLAVDLAGTLNHLEHSLLKSHFSSVTKAQLQSSKTLKVHTAQFISKAGNNVGAQPSALE